MMFFNILFMICIFPICMGFFTVEPLEAIVVMFMGKVVKVVKKPGLSWYFPIGRVTKKVSMGNMRLSFLIKRNQHNGIERIFCS
jgi:regulator of protease activity HflC (stomatin/prohibitin superfamily)